jgi:hypothetical protein
LANETWIALALPHNTCAISSTIIWAFEGTTNSYVTIMTTITNFADTTAPGTLPTPHAIVRTGFYFSFTCFTNVADIAKTLSKMTFTTFRTTSYAW